MKEEQVDVYAKGFNRPSVPVRGAPGAPYKGKPRAQVRADVDAGVARTVAMSIPQIGRASCRERVYVLV